MVWTSILKFAGEKLGKVVAEQLIQEFGGTDAARLKATLLGKDDEVKESLRKLDERVKEIAAVVKNTELHDVFFEYNRAGAELARLRKAYEAHAHKPVDDRNRQAACLDVLSSNGVFTQGRRMIEALSFRNAPRNASFLQEYSDILIREYVDAFGYCARLDAIMGHLKFNLIGAAVLRHLCYNEISDKTKAQDSEIALSEIAQIDTHFTDVTKSNRNIVDLFDRMASANEQLILQHYPTGLYLTGYADGTPLSEDDPFKKEGYNFSIFQRASRHGMPQVFVIERGRGQERRYSNGVPAAGGGSVRFTTVRLDGDSQEWQLTKLMDGEETAFMLQHRKSGRALDAAHEGRVYMTPLNKENKHMWWQPVLTTNKAGQFDGSVFLLKHKIDQYALDSNGQRVYAEERRVDHGNIFMKWRLRTDTNSLESGEFLLPGQEIVSKNKKYVLQYEGAGNLRLLNKDSQSVLWDTNTGGNGAWRCWMQAEDGHFVVYADEQQPVWATGCYAATHAGSRAVLQDDGSLEIVRPDGQLLWRKAVDGSVQS